MSSDSDSDLSLKSLLKDFSDDDSLVEESFAESILDELSPPKSEPSKEKNCESENENIPDSFTRRRFLLDCVVPRILFPDEEDEEVEEPRSSTAIFREMCEYDVDKACVSRSEEKKTQSRSDSSNEDSSSDLESVPKRLMRPDICKLCDVVFSSERQATNHYEGQTHHKKKRHYIENKLFEREKALTNESSRLTGANTIVKRTRYSSDEEEDQDPWQCIICDIRLSSALAARAHYAGKSHKRKEEYYQSSKKKYREDDLRDRLNRKRRESEDRKSKKHRRHRHHHHHHRHHSDSS